MKNWFASHFNFHYLFNPKPTAENSLIYLAIIFILIIILGILVSAILAKKSQRIKPYENLKNKIFTVCLFIGIIGLMLVFFAWQEIPYLSIPILLVILILVLIWQSVYIILFWQKNTKAEIKVYQKELKYQRYLPKHKKQSK